MTYEEWKKRLCELMDECQANAVALKEHTEALEKVDGDYDQEEVLAYIIVKAKRLENSIEDL